jgi:2-hydroxy-3-keto-5-methylthiopentenyl-1-phosphate phosphatase
VTGHEAPGPAYVIVSDFDGTAAEADVQQVILDALADREEWRRINRIWADGHMTTAQRARRQWELISASEAEVLAVIAAQRLDPAFPAFAHLCDERGYPLYIVSDGFDFYIYPLLRQAHLEHLPVVANSLRYVQGTPEMRFLLQRSPDQYYANDKTYVMERLRRPGSTLVYIGDGYSDRAAAHHADLLFAKDRLADYCVRQGIGFEPFTTFQDILAYFTHHRPAGAGRI